MYAPIRRQIRPNNFFLPARIAHLPTSLPKPEFSFKKLPKFQKGRTMFPKVPLLVQILIAVTLGIFLGDLLPVWMIRSFATFQSIFSAWLDFAIPLIILGLVISGISALGRNSGKFLLLTIFLAYGSTMFSGFGTWFACSELFPPLLHGTAFTPAPKEQEALLGAFFSIELPPVMDVMTALALAFVLGIGISAIQSETLQKAADDFRTIVELLILKAIIPFLPLFIFCIFLAMSANDRVWEILNIFGKIIGIVFALHFILLAIQFLASGAIARKNPFKMFWTMLPAYFTALGTSSSVATIPVTLAQVQKNGVRPQVAEFCVPLCATIHLAGSTMKITAFSIAIMLLTGGHPDLAHYAPFIMFLGITMVAAPGVPGGAIMAAAALLGSVLGFSEEAVGLMIALYLTTDCFGTACNVCGDGAIAQVVNTWMHDEDETHTPECASVTSGENA